MGADSFFGNVLTPYGFVWIATAHAVQYLWVTSYFARTSGSDARLLPYLGKAALAGYAIWTVPALIFAPGLLGRLPYESGLALLVAAMVNLHHFILDGAIWKLRDGRIARVLLRSQADGESTPVQTPRRRWIPALVWGSGALSVLVAVGACYEGEVGRRSALADRDMNRVQVAAKRLAWLGRDGPTIHQEIGRAHAEQHQEAAASHEFERSLDIYPTTGAWLDLARMQESAGDLEQAIHSFDRALELDSESVEALYRSGLLHLKRGDTGEAIPRLQRASELAPGQGVLKLTLERARRQASRTVSP